MTIVRMVTVGMVTVGVVTCSNAGVIMGALVYL